MDPQVQPLQVITKPMGNTKLDNPIWFVCTIPNASMHRQDGKKLPFVNGFLKVLMKEDLTFLINEVDDGNPYVRLANQDEINQARMIENPLGVIKDAVRQEVVNDFTVEELEALIAKKRSSSSQQPKNPIPGETPPPAPPGETDNQRMQRLAAEALAKVQGTKLTPGSTANVPGAASNSQG